MVWVLPTEVITTDSALDLARAAYSSCAWTQAWTQYALADRDTPLEPQDLEQYATAAFLIGEDAASTELWARAHTAHLERDAVGQAVQCAFWLGFGLGLRGEMAPAAGWHARAQRLIDDYGQDCVERGYLLIPAGIQHLYRGEGAGVVETATQAAEIAARFPDPNLTALCQLLTGQGLIMIGESRRGVAMLDEVMVTITTERVSPMIVGLVYCAVIDACRRIYDLRRAREWTAALTHWCQSQPDLVPYRGQCLVHRVQIMQFHGAWPDAMDEAQRACDRLSTPSAQPALGMALYEQAELHRLRGETDQAEQAYHRASRWGHDPQPGLALLRLTQGRLDAAEAAIRRTVDETSDMSSRPRLLPAYVEILLAAKDLVGARAGAEELNNIATFLDAPVLHAIATHENGAVLLAEGDARQALGALRRAWSRWQQLDAPYEAARARVLVGLACRELGDEDSARMELDAAATVFQQLGAAPDLARAIALSTPASIKATGALTAREVEVLRLVATGKTNRAVAADLFLSEKTVARHLSNIFTKLDLGSRSAATAYAYEHELL
jgi:ATP/maltotriose-dependent transcriptional regulator MalT